MKEIKDFVDMMEALMFTEAREIQNMREYIALKASISPVSEDKPEKFDYWKHQLEANKNPRLLSEQPTDTQYNNEWIKCAICKKEMLIGSPVYTPKDYPNNRREEEKKEPQKQTLLEWIRNTTFLGQKSKYEWTEREHYMLDKISKYLKCLE